ncbi:MAG: hypothetical protein IJ816_05355 [Alloprevotella sp.]|nr:hypothetical protein [Alloprevotella sp.]
MATTRQSNMELLRVITMFGILLLHANYFCFGYPKFQLVNSHILTYPGRYFLEYLCISAVDVFVMISGWFGIRARLNGALRLLYQILFCGVAVGLFMIARGQLTSSFGRIFQNACGMWFVWSYLMLYILSPALNAFIEKASEREVRNFLWAMLAMELFDKLSNLSLFFSGFSPLHFVFIYVLARYIRLYLAPRWQQVSTHRFVIAFFGLTLLMVSLQWLAGFVGSIKFYTHCTHYFTIYTNPLCIAQAAMLILIFSRLKIQNRTINYLASAALAVYLLHQNPYVRQEYCDIFRTLHATYPIALALVLDFVAICCVYLVAVGVDTLRQISWRWIENLYYRLLPKKESTESSH